jgi:hypothetical protein
MRGGCIAVARDRASPRLPRATWRRTIRRTLAAGIAGSPSRGGRAVAAAVARHHHLDRSKGTLMFSWTSDENGTSVSATERLRSALRFLRRVIAARIRR